MCGSGPSIQIVGGTLTLSGGASGTIAAPTPVPTAPAYPVIATYGVAPVVDSTGDPRFVVPGSMLSKTAAFTANFSTTLTYQARASKNNPYGPVQQVTFSTRPGTSTAISANFDRPSNALAVLFVPMGDAAKTYNTQWTATGQQALQDGMTAAVSREYPLPAGIGNLGGTGGLRYAVAPTLIDLRRLNLLDSSGKFCGNGANYDAIQAQLAQFRLSYNTANPNAQANRVVGVVDPAVGIDGPAVNQPCFEGMAVVNSQQAWALALPGRSGQLIGIEMAHTLGLVPPDRESPFDGAHSQNITAENPSLNRRFNVVQRSFITTDRSLMKPTATNPAPDNVDTLLEVPDFAFLLCVMGGTVIPECQTYGQPGSVNANAPVGSTIAFVMSGTTDSSSTASLCSTCTGEAGGTSVVESYFGSVPLTIPSSTSTYRFVQRNSAGAIVSNQGVPVTFGHSEHGTGTSTNNHTSGLFSFALPFQTTTNRVELWKGSPGASGSRLLYAQNSSAAPQVTGFTVGNVIPFLLPGRKPARARVPAISQAVETLSARTDAPTTPTTITPSSSLSTTVSFGNSFSSISDQAGPTFTVNTNTDPSTPLDTGCTETECTLREAIEAANADPADNTIQFSLAGSTEIDLGSALPAIVGKVAILGSSQPAGQVTVNGAGVSEGASAFLLGNGSDGSEIDDLAIDHFSGGVGIEVVSASNSVSGNDISAVDTGIYVHGPDASANQIGGARSDGIGNRIWDFVSFGIHLDTADTGNTVQGNTIGLDASGDASGGSTGLSVDATSGTVVGSDVGPSELANVNYDFGNVVVAGTDGDGAGILITNQATGTILAGNFIGTDDTQTATNLGNLGVGIDVSAGSDGNQIGPGNIVAFNGGPTRPGVRVTNAVGDRIVANSIHDNGGQGIVLSNGNDGLASPQLGSASISAGTTTVSGKISGVPGGQLLRRVLQERLVRLFRLGRGRDVPRLRHGHGLGQQRGLQQDTRRPRPRRRRHRDAHEHHDRRHVRVLELRDGAGAAVPSSRPGALHRDCERRPPGRRQARRLPRLPRAARPGHLRRPAPRQRGQREPHSNMVGDDRHLARTTPLQRGGCGERRVHATARHADRNPDGGYGEQPGRRSDLEPPRGREDPAVRAHPPARTGPQCSGRGRQWRTRVESQRSRDHAQRDGTDRRSPAADRGLACRFVHRDTREVREHRPR